MTTYARPHAKRARWATPRKTRRFGAGVWAFVAFIVLIAATLAVTMAAEDPTSSTGSELAPGFSLASTDGATVDLSDYQGSDVLLYFNEGVGCDPCFQQMVDIEHNAEAFREEGLTVLPVVVNPAADVRRELDRFGIETPFLIDPDKRVSRAYRQLGTGHHADLPGHGFVLIDASGRITWQKTYASMFVTSEELLRDMGRGMRG